MTVMKLIRPALILIACALASTVFCSAAQTADSISSHLIDHESHLPQLANLSFENPAQNQWRWQSTLSSVDLGLFRTRQTEPANPQEGTGMDFWHFHAASYMKHRSSTLWGDASYRNGKLRQKQWCEAVDIDIIYPYYPADERGGDMKMENYSFSGGYADHTDRWAWGGYAGYDAGLYYRDIDPRPKIVTGKLEISAGVSYRAGGDYRLGVGAEFLKYKQSSAISFQSEMGEDKIFHTTGMGTHYVRFAGNGATTYYNGYRYGAGLSLIPSSMTGFTAAVSLRRLTFNTILSDLNKLPLSNVWHNDMRLQAGYLHRSESTSWGTALQFEIYKRHGHENIFGDATGSIYPQIGSVTAYADNHYAINLSGVWEHWISPSWKLSTSAEATYAHRCESYFTPARQSLTDQAGAKLNLSAHTILPHGWTAAATVVFESKLPVSGQLILREEDEKTETAPLIEIERIRHRYATTNSNTSAVEAQLSRAVTSRYAIRISGRYKRTVYSGAARVSTAETALAFIF